MSPGRQNDWQRALTKNIEQRQQLMIMDSSCRLARPTTINKFNTLHPAGDREQRQHIMNLDYVIMSVISVGIRHLP